MGDVQMDWLQGGRWSNTPDGVDGVAYVSLIGGGKGWVVY